MFNFFPMHTCGCIYICVEVNNGKESDSMEKNWKNKVSQSEEFTVKVDAITFWFFVWGIYTHRLVDWETEVQSQVKSYWLKKILT